MLEMTYNISRIMQMNNSQTLSRVTIIFREMFCLYLLLWRIYTHQYIIRDEKLGTSKKKSSSLFTCNIVIQHLPRKRQKPMLGRLLQSRESNLEPFECNELQTSIQTY